MGKNKDKVSIVCVTFNAVNYIERCLQSIFNQSYSNIEIVIIDGNSTDGTQTILEKYNDKIAFWKSEPDKGIYDAMNKAIEYVSGNWVYFIGADDELLPEFSDFAENELIDYNTVYYSNIIFKGLKQAGKKSPYKQLKKGIYHQSMIYPIAVFKKYRYNLDYKIAADNVLNFQVYADKQFKIVYRNYVIAKFNDTGICHNYRDKKFYDDLPKFALKYFGWGIYLRYQLRQLKYIFKQKKTSLIDI